MFSKLFSIRTVLGVKRPMATVHPFIRLEPQLHD